MPFFSPSCQQPGLEQQHCAQLFNSLHAHVLEEYIPSVSVDLFQKLVEQVIFSGFFREVIKRCQVTVIDREVIFFGEMN
jgi:hypothetical protein